MVGVEVIDADFTQSMKVGSPLGPDPSTPASTMCGVLDDVGPALGQEREQRFHRRDLLAHRVPAVVDDDVERAVPSATRERNAGSS